MQPAVPEPPEQDGSWYAGPSGMSADDVGAFEQGTEFTRWALARYIVGRVILERVSWVLLVVVGVLLVLAAALEWAAHLTILAVLVLLVALVVLAMRGLLRVVLRRLMGAGAYGPLESRIREITGGASDGVLRELRRVGLPGRVLTLPLIGIRLIGKRRKQTMARIKQFDVERAVPKARRDELYLVLQQATGRQPPPAA